MKTKLIQGGVTAPQGFVANGLSAGIKKSGKKDLALVYSKVPCTATGVFTTNKVQASCVVINKKRLKNGKAQAILINSGNANCLTGSRGYEDSLTMIEKTADLLRISPAHVCVASTGIIGRLLPVEKVFATLPQLVADLSKKGGGVAAEGIMTTDHVSKEAAVEILIGKRIVRIGAIAKGGGMIHPNMATMLCFVSTDAAIALPALRAALKNVVQKTFNMITVDGDMSTNDMVLVLANGSAGNQKITNGSKDFVAFESALHMLFLEIVKMMMKDAEGATKSIEVKVSGAKSEKDARLVARSIAASSLVKTAMHGGDPNWGRIAAAAGYSGGYVDQSKMNIFLGKVLVMKKGEAVEGSEKKAAAFVRSKEVLVSVELGVGDGSATAYTCDLSEEYVTFNSAYHT